MVKLTKFIKFSNTFEFFYKIEKNQKVNIE